jgi:hypothetical protein
MKKKFLLATLTCLNLSGYTSLHQAQEQVSSLAKGKESPFIAQDFKDLLTHVVHQKETIGYTGRYLLKVTPYPATKFVIWGPLKGSFDSLVRALTYANQQGIIGEDLTIREPSLYLVFAGDLIGDSDTSLETLYLVLSLIKANPKKVFYLKGTIEDALNWQNNGLKSALKEKVSKVSDVADEALPLGRLMTKFFNTLPLALYITDLNGEDSIRVSYFSRDYEEINEFQCGALLTKKNINVPQICYINTPEKGPASVKVIIKSEQRVMSYRRHPGLMVVEPDRGAVAWSIFSGPTPTYQKEYDFYSDAFVILTTGESLKETTISLYRHDIRTPASVSFSTFNLLTGIKLPETKKKQPEPDITQIQKKLQELYHTIEQLLSEVTHLTNSLSDHEEKREQL